MSGNLKARSLFTLGVTLIAVIFIGYIGIAFMAGYPPFKGPAGQTTTMMVSSTTLVGTACSPNVQQPVNELVTHYSSDHSLGSNVQWNRFVQNSQGQLVQVADNPGTLTDGSAKGLSTNLYSIGPPSNTYENIYQGTNTNYAAYPVWYQVNAGMYQSPVQQFGNTVFQISCLPSTTNPSAYTWAETAVLFGAPGNAATSTTNATAAIQYPAGAPSAFPTTATTWNVNLNLNVGYKTAMLPYSECGTQANPVYNYGTSTEYYGCPSGPGQAGLPTVQGYLIVIANQTGIAVTANGLQTIKSPALSAGTLAWAIPVTANGVAPSSASSSNPYLAVSVPVTVVEQVSATGHHGDLIFWFVDMQQLAFLQNNLSSAAVTGWSTIGATGAGTAGAGSALSSYFGGLTPTTGQNAGNPSAIISQYIGVELTY